MPRAPIAGPAIAAAKCQAVSVAPPATDGPSRIVGLNQVIKRSFDIIGAAGLLVLATPLMLVVAIGIRLSSRGPVFFVQKRVGYRGETFPFLKFRSMHCDSDDQIHRDYVQKWIRDGAGSAVALDDGKKVHKLVEDPRVFRFGRFIRKYSLDELPQLLNVLRGDMSLIGPRPAMEYEVALYQPWHRRRLDGPPGITGLWQVSGRNRLTFDEMVALDIKYLETWSLLRDLKILVRTAWVVVFEPAH